MKPNYFIDTNNNVMTLIIIPIAKCPIMFLIKALIIMSIITFVSRTVLIKKRYCVTKAGLTINSSIVVNKIYLAFLEPSCTLFFKCFSSSVPTGAGILE